MLVSPKTLSCCNKGRIRDLLKTDLLLWWHVKEIDRKNNGNSYHLFLYWGRSTTAFSKQKSLQKVYYVSKTFLLAELLTRYQCFTALTKFCSFSCVTLSNWEPLHNNCTSCVIVRLTYFLVWHDFLPISLLYLLLCISRPILTVAIVRIPYYLKCWLDSCMEGYCSHCSVLFYYDMWLCRIKSLRVVIHHTSFHPSPISLAKEIWYRLS